MISMGAVWNAIKTEKSRETKIHTMVPGDVLVDWIPHHQQLTCTTKEEPARLSRFFLYENFITGN